MEFWMQNIFGIGSITGLSLSMQIDWSSYEKPWSKTVFEKMENKCFVFGPPLFKKWPTRAIYKITATITFNKILL